jgi:hypothetical protein
MNSTYLRESTLGEDTASLSVCIVAASEGVVDLHQKTGLSTSTLRGD